jgi:RecQ family ATP-dependent DNA helicase
MPKSLQPGPIFRQLKQENFAKLPADQWEQLWQVMQRLGREYTDFRTKKQGEITLKFLRGENVFGVLPTSAGKSFTFQTVARMTDGLTIVISPLIALMKDQVAKHRDGEALYFNSDLTPFLRKEVKRRIREGKVRLLYVSPERLKQTDFKDLLASSRQRVRRLVIDEAHCVIEWGYGFRVKYLHIAQEIESFESQLPKQEKIPILLLTATASPWLQRETAKNLCVSIQSANYITQTDGADRPELKISLRIVRDDREKIRWIAKQLKRDGSLHKKRGIVFSAFAEGGEGLGARNAPGICDELQELGIKRIGYYHGGMDLQERRKVQKDFQQGKIDILVATKAFGMGIDLPKLDFIIHFYPPLSLEEYWQEAGRGGRGMEVEQGESCQCIVLHNPSDYKVLQGFTNLASFEKILSTFTCAVQGEMNFKSDAIALRGALRKVLTDLQAHKYIHRLKSVRVGGITLERWKLRRPAGMVVKRIEKLFKENNGLKTKQTKRLRNNLRIRTDRQGDIIRVEHDADNGGRALDYYDTELNWLTEREIGALEMLDDCQENGKYYSRFRIAKKKLSRKDMQLLARKIKSYRDGGKAKLGYVFNSFLKSKRGKAKEAIAKYLKTNAKPA